MKTNSPNISKKILTGAIGLIFSLSAFSQNMDAASRPEAPSLWSNPVFIILLGIILLLFIVIVVLADVLKGTARYTQDSRSGNISKYLSVAALICLSASGAQAQTTATDYFSQIDPALFYLMVGVILFEVLIIGILLNSVKILLRSSEDLVPSAENEVDVILDKLNASVAIEEEGTIMFDHEYDGIRELDNNLPPWWKYGFYITIVWSFAYIIYFHVTHDGPSSSEEYITEVKKAETAIAEYMKHASSLVDETNVKFLSDVSTLESGKQIYVDNCAVCHKADGGGNVGPNLTDEYWLYGGSIKDIFKTIKYGYSDKGMKAWKDDLSPSQIAMVSSYVKTLHGTNPPDAKEKQGDLYKEEIITADSAKNLNPGSIQTIMDTSVAAKK